MLVHVGLLALGAACVWAVALEHPLSTLVTETVALLAAHHSLLIGNESLRIPVPAHKNHQLCMEEVFEGINTLKNQTAREDGVEKLFQNLFLIKKHIDLQRKKCGEERRKVRHFLDYLQEFLGVINTEWPVGR